MTSLFANTGSPALDVSTGAPSVYEFRVRTELRATERSRPRTIQLVVPQPGASRLLADVETRLALLPSGAVAAQAREVVRELRDALADVDPDGLPSFILTESDDGSAAVEWWFPTHRLAFTLEPNSEHSGWHFVSSRACGGVLESGYLAELKIAPLLRRVRRFQGMASQPSASAG